MSQPCVSGAAGLVLVGGIMMSVAAAQSGGSIHGWGNQVQAPQSDLVNIVAVAAGGPHTLAL